MDSAWRDGSRESLLRTGRELDQGNRAVRTRMEEVLQIRNRSGRNMPLMANPAQQEYEAKAGKKNIILKARQMGITTWIAGRFFLRTITHPGMVTVQVAHTQEAAEAIFRIVHRYLARLPKALREGALKSARCSAQRILFPDLDSEYLVETAGDRNAGRGLTIANLHCTELARWPGDAEETLAGLRAALATDGEMVIESTPGGAAGCFWKEWREAEKAGIVRHFFPWWLEDAYTASAVKASSLTQEEGRLMTIHGLTLRQIGYRRRIHDDFRGLARQEYAEDAESCFLASGSCYFDTEAIDRRLNEAASPSEKRGDLWIWGQPQPNRRYLVAVDPAGGGAEGDYAAAQVIDLGSGLQCAELRSHLEPLELAQTAAKLAQQYNRALLAVERNNHGSAVLAYLHTVCRYEPVYSGEGGQQGWLTSTVSRPAMLAALAAALVETPALFSSSRLLHECRTFVRGRDGRPAAAAGEHDDCVMAMAIALAVRTEVIGGKRLSVA